MKRYWTYIAIFLFDEWGEIMVITLTMVMGVILGLLGALFIAMVILIIAEAVQVHRWNKETKPVLSCKDTGDLSADTWDVKSPVPYELLGLE